MVKLVDILLFGIFFILSMGLGYAVLNRFDPTNLSALADTTYYGNIVLDGINGINGEYMGRLLLPYLGHLIYLIVPAIGTWHMANFSLLLVNSFLTALSAMMILKISLRVTKNIEYSLVSCMFFLLNFNVINFYLVGSIDSGYGFSMLLVVYCLECNKWSFLPLIAIVGCIAKEVFLPIGSSMILGWLVYDFYRNKHIEIIKVASFILFMIAGAITVISLDIYMGGNTYLYWDDLIKRTNPAFFDSNITSFLSNSIKFIFTIGWVLILAIPGLKKLPANIVISSIFSCSAAIFLGWWVGVGGADYARFIFIPGSFALSLASAISMLELLKRYSYEMKI
jgi:hypothetical protein